MATTAAQVRARLSNMLQPDAAPTLTQVEVDDLFRMARVADAAGNEPDNLDDWAPSSAVQAGAYAAPTVRNGFYYRATVGGSTGATEPTWPTVIGNTVADGGVTWECEGLAPWLPTFNIRRAAAEGWDWKAAKVVAQYDLQAGSANLKRSGIYAHCRDMARKYRSGSFSSVGMGTGLSG